ncbi:hypothetical protein HMPREF1207_05620 [Paenibacillus sp. HGH0039]|nr:hypothetical protein HMPREF1207_05620 [Paenibacillus sp. HGH0039]
MKFVIRRTFFVAFIVPRKVFMACRSGSTSVYVTCRSARLATPPSVGSGDLKEAGASASRSSLQKNPEAPWSSPTCSSARLATPPSAGCRADSEDLQEAKSRRRPVCTHPDRPRQKNPEAPRSSPACSSARLATSTVRRRPRRLRGSPEGQE